MSRLLTTWNPWREMNRIRDEFRGLSPVRFSMPRFEFREQPALNVWRGEGKLVIATEIPGVDPEAIDVTVTPESFTIKITRPAVEPVEGESRLLQERPTGLEERMIELPFAVDPELTEAVYERGVLTVTLHQTESQKPKKVAIKAE